MSKLIKLGLLAAAGYGTYEVLRRTGMLTKAGEWLEQQIPDDIKERAYELRDRARAHAEDLADQAGRTIREATGYAAQTTEQAAPSGGGGDSHGNGHGHAHRQPATGQTMTGAGTGVPLTTDDYDGAHVSHKVGRGVVR